jgi:murein DD-endopeptidase MepM/ murein hydrolase activator NlpD
VVGVSSSAPGPLTFQARAIPIVNGAPAPGADIGTYQEFAIYAHDPWGGDDGTDNASGVRWPHVTGTRNGQPFRYACSVPKLVRDAINTCFGMQDTFYRLPFPHLTPTHVNQGNFGTTSHNGWQVYALDLSADLDDPISAARAGTVKKVVSNSTVHCIGGVLQPNGGNCPDFFGNHVAIEHADGNVSWYMHMKPGSASVSVGQHVARGQLIGQVGLTGNTSGPHLHFHVTDPSESFTVPLTYQAYDPVSPYLSTCFVPQEDDWYTSNNAP